MANHGYWLIVSIPSKLYWGGIQQGWTESRELAKKYSNKDSAERAIRYAIPDAGEALMTVHILN
jgi:hypothetical protein